MPDLPEVEQDFIANVTRYLEGLRSAISMAQDFAKANAEATASVEALHRAIDDLPEVKRIQVIVDTIGGTGIGRAVAAASGGAVGGTVGGAGGDTSAVLSDAAAIAQANAEIRAGLAGVAEEGQVAAETINTVAVATKAAGAAASDARVRYLGWWGILGRPIPLFGGLLGSIAVWHLLIESVAEFIAVVVPATVAVIAFGAAAQKTAETILDRMQAVRTVMSATGQVIPPMTGAFQQLQAAVRPDVYQLFGDMLDIINSKTDEFRQLALGAGGVLDTLAARFTVAVTSGNGLGVFLKNAIPDLAMIGNIIGNVGGMFASVFKAMPGYAEILLTVVDAISKVGEAFFQAAEPVLAWGLKIHGALVWLGVATTAVLLLGSAVIKMGAAFLATDIGAFVSLLFEVRSAADAAALGMIALDAVSPLGWVALAIGALTALIVIFKQGKDATTQWTDSLQRMVDASSMFNGLNNTMKATIDVGGALVIANQKLAVMNEQVAASAQHASRSMQNGNQQYINAYNRSQELTNSLHKFQDQQNIGIDRMGALAGAVGGFTQAETLASMAGVKWSQVLHDNAANWAIDEQKVLSLRDSLQAMGIQQGILQNSVNAVNLAVLQQDSKVSQLNSGWQNFISTVSGGETSFVKFAQDLATVRTNSQAAGASFNGLNAASLTLRQSFQQMVTDSQTFLAALQTQVSVSGLAANGTNLLARAGKDLVTQLLPMAAQSAQVKDQVYALAQIAGFKGVDSLKSLSQWAGNQGAAKAMQDLNRITGILTGSTSDLARDVKNLSDALGTMVNQQMAQAILKTVGFQDAVSTLTKDIMNSGSTMQSTRSARQTFINDLEMSGIKSRFANAEYQAFLFKILQGRANMDATHMSRQAMITDLFNMGKKAGDTSGQIVTMIHKITGIPKQSIWNMIIHGSATGHVQITVGTAFSAVQRTGTSGPAIAHPRHAKSGRLAAGGIVHGQGTSTSDSIPAWLSHGEYVLNARAVAHYGKQTLDHMNAMKFANGGPVLRLQAGGAAETPKATVTGTPGVMTGQWFANFYGNFKKQFNSATHADLAAALHSALARALAAGMSRARAEAQAMAAAAGGGGLGGVPGRVGGSAAAMAYARSLLGRMGWAGQWSALYNLWMRESGWNPYAVNPSSGAYGIPQSLGHGHPFNLGDYANQIRWGLNYISGRYGTPSAAWAHELAYGWYDKGGYLPPGLSLALNTTGRMEPVGDRIEPGERMIEVHSHVHLDGKEIWKAVQRETLRYNTRNTGSRTGTFIPGTTPQT